MLLVRTRFAPEHCTSNCKAKSRRDLLFSRLCRRLTAGLPLASTPRKRSHRRALVQSKGSKLALKPWASFRSCSMDCRSRDTMLACTPRIPARMSKPKDRENLRSFSITCAKPPWSPNSTEKYGICLGIFDDSLRTPRVSISALFCVSNSAKMRHVSDCAACTGTHTHCCTRLVVIDLFGIDCAVFSPTYHSHSR